MTYKIVKVYGNYAVEFYEPKRAYNNYFLMDRAELLDRITNLQQQHMSAETELKALAELNARSKEGDDSIKA